MPDLALNLAGVEGGWREAQTMLSHVVALQPNVLSNEGDDAVGFGYCILLLACEMTVGTGSRGTMGKMEPKTMS